MKIKLSDADRMVIANLHRSVPWQGSEANVVALYELGEALRLTDHFKRYSAKPIDKLGRTPTFAAELSREQLETLIGLASGGGQPIRGEMGPTLGELVVRLRKMVPAKPVAAADAA